MRFFSFKQLPLLSLRGRGAGLFEGTCRPAAASSHDADGRGESGNRRRVFARRSVCSGCRRFAGRPKIGCRWRHGKDRKAGAAVCRNRPAGPRPVGAAKKPPAAPNCDLRPNRCFPKTPILCCQTLRQLLFMRSGRRSDKGIRCRQMFGSARIGFLKRAVSKPSGTIPILRRGTIRRMVAAKWDCPPLRRGFETAA